MKIPEKINLSAEKFLKNIRSPAIDSGKNGACRIPKIFSDISPPTTGL